MTTCYILLLQDKPILKYAQWKDTFNGCCSVCIYPNILRIIVFYQFVKELLKELFMKLKTNWNIYPHTQLTGLLSIMVGYQQSKPKLLIPKSSFCENWQALVNNL